MVGGQHGDVFTKPEVVDFMLDEVGYVAFVNLSQVSIMEPSCGEGEFVLEIVRRLKKSSEIFGFDLNDAFQRCVSASDIDEEKIKICIQRLAEEIPEIAHPERKLFVEDYLLAAHPQVDIVVGNPPYIRYEEIPEDKLPLYKAFPTFYYRADMYVLFFEKSLSQMKPNGRHCFICANRWMRNKYGTRLRKLVARYYYIEKIINMEGVNAFQEEVLAYPAITLIANRISRRGYTLFADNRTIDNLQSLEYKVLNAPDSDDWSKIFNVQEQELSLIEEQNFKIGIGVATGADGIFISKDLKDKVEPELLLPVINGRDLTGDKMKWGGRYFLNPYDKSGALISLEQYPKAKAYLEAHKEQLSSRHKAKKAPSRWYSTIDFVSPTLKNEAKILLPDISGNAIVFVDEGWYYPQHNIYYITGNGVRQLKILAALLMSDFVRLQLDNLTNHMNGGYARWQSQYLRKLQIPSIAHIPSHLADALLKCYSERDIEGINYITDEVLAYEKDNPILNTAKQSKSQQLRFAFA